MGKYSIDSLHLAVMIGSPLIVAQVVPQSDLNI